MKKFAIQRTASLGLMRACSQRVNWATEKKGFVAHLLVVVFHIPEGINREQLAIFLYLTSFLNIFAVSIDLACIFISYYLIIIT
jgi:hypothetical protein